MTDHANELRRYSRKIGHPAGDVPSVMLAAADEIERLAARLEAAEKTNKEWLRANAPGGWIDNLRVENETLAANLRGKHSTAGATYAHLIAERDALRAAVQHEAACVEAAKAEIAALRAKIERMEQQEPVGVLHVGSYYGEELQDWEFEANQCACDKLNEAYVRNPMSLPLYALPGAQPAPSVPTALLVAVANLVAQMEIVSRVGFVDTPDDKDSCAAFCVAEGTWLELMSAIESLASALAAAQEAKP